MSTPTFTMAQVQQMILEAQEQWAYPPEVHFKKHRVPPSGWQYLGPDDHLQVSIYTTASTTGLNLSYRYLHSDGSMQYATESLDGVATSTLTTKIFKLAEGWLLGLSISNLGGGLADQVCFVAVGLQAHGKANTAPHTILAQGYVSNLFTVDWPPVYVRGPAPWSGSAAWNLIQKQVVSTPAASVTFSGIAGTYSHLVLTANGRVSDAAVTVGLGVQFNGDTGSNYDYQAFEGKGNTNSSFTQAAGVEGLVARWPGSTASANVVGAFNAWLEYYAGTTFFKTMRANYGTLGTLGTGTTYATGQYANQWRNTAALTSITIIDGGGGNFIAGSTFSLYGVP